MTSSSIVNFLFKCGQDRSNVSLAQFPYFFGLKSKKKKKKKKKLQIVCNTTLLGMNVKNYYFAQNRVDNNVSFDTLADVLC